MRRILILLFCVLFMAAPIFTQGFGGTGAQGAGSGLDADKLDGQEGAYYDVTSASGALVYVLYDNTLFRVYVSTDWWSQRESYFGERATLSTAAATGDWSLAGNLTVGYQIKASSYYLTGSNMLFAWYNPTSFQIEFGTMTKVNKMKIGNFALEEDSTDSDGIEIIGAYHAAANGGVAGNICLHEGTPPAVSGSGTGHRLWAATTNYLHYQDADGVNHVVLTDDGSQKVTIPFDPPAVNGVVDNVLTINVADAGNSWNLNNGVGGGILFKIPDDDATGFSEIGARISGYKDSNAENDSSGGLKFEVSQDDTTLDLAMTIDSAGDIYSVAWTDYGGISTLVGWSGTPTANIWYKKVGNLVFVYFYINGTSDSTTTTFTLPYTNNNNTYAEVDAAIRLWDNGVNSTTSGRIYLAPNSNTVTCYIDWAAGTFTNANAKIVIGQFFYEAQ